MIQDIFLTYANNSLKGNPENLHKILSAIEENLEIDLEGVSGVIDIICKLSRYTDPEPILSIIEADSDFRPLFGHGTRASLARDAVAGGRDSYYSQAERFRDDPDLLKELGRHRFGCELRAMNKEMLGEDLCEESFVLKCYECHQLKVVHLLQEIVDGKEYSKIEDIGRILFDSSTVSTQRTEPTIVTKPKPNTHFKEALHGYDYLIMGLTEYTHSELGNSEHAFNEYLNCIAYFSLTEFLVHNDRRKLKKCPYCDKFFIAKDIKKLTCYSNKCKKAYEREKKRKQRERDLAKYY